MNITIHTRRLGAEMTIRKIGNSIRKNLITYSLFAVASGLMVGNTFQLPLLNLIIPFALFLMLYPTFLDADKGRITGVITAPCPLILAMLLNFIVSPALMYGLTEFFSVGMAPGLMVGLLIFGMIPAGGMGPVYTGMINGNMNLAIAISTVSLLLSLASIPIWSWLLIGKVAAVPKAVILKYLFLIIFIPLMSAVLTKKWLIRTRGLAAFEEIKVLLQSTSGIGLMLMLFIIFALNGRFVIENLPLIAKVLFPTTSFSLLLLIGSTCLGLAFSLSYEDSVALTISATVKNTAIAMALATSIFHGQEALAIAVAGPLVQFPVMLCYLKILTRFSVWNRTIIRDRI